MNTPQPNDDQLKAALKQWNVSAPLPPRFQEGVWRRIEQAELISSQPSWFANALAVIDRLFARPALSYSYVLVLLALGLAAGYVKTQKDAEGFRSELASRYVQAIDPYHKAADR
jgi:hypothetical protein